MKRTLIISDIHGCLDPFNSLLKKVNYTPKEDQLILLGDYVDRGPNSKDVMEQVIHMVQEDGVIAIRGNHDHRLLELVNTKENAVVSKFFEHGGKQTLESYLDINEVSLDQLDDAKKYMINNYEHHITFIDSLPYYYEDSYHIYVHAGLNPNFINWKEQEKHDFMYIKDRFIKHETVVDKIVVFGHTKTIDIHETADIWFGGDKIGIDGGSAYGLQLNCLEISGEHEYRTYKVNS